MGKIKGLSKTFKVREYVTTASTLNLYYKFIKYANKYYKNVEVKELIQNGVSVSGIAQIDICFEAEKRLWFRIWSILFTWRDNDDKKDN